MVQRGSPRGDERGADHGLGHAQPIERADGAKSIAGERGEHDQEGDVRLGEREIGQGARRSGDGNGASIHFIQRFSAERFFPTPAHAKTVCAEDPGSPPQCTQNRRQSAALGRGSGEPTRAPAGCTKR